MKLRLGAPTAAIRDELVPEFHRAITELAKLFGPFPFPSLSVARLPAQGGGIEYPSSILMLDGSRLVAVHETAHQWFYAMVGDSQALHPWLDEAFAQYAEQLVDGSQDPSGLRCAGPGRRVDRVVRRRRDRATTSTTYNKGAAALEAARNAAGATEVGRRAALLRRGERLAHRQPERPRRRRCTSLPAGDRRAAQGRRPALSPPVGPVSPRRRASRCG